MIANSSLPVHRVEARLLGGEEAAEGEDAGAGGLGEAGGAGGGKEEDDAEEEYTPVPSPSKVQ